MYEKNTFSSIAWRKWAILAAALLIVIIAILVAVTLISRIGKTAFEVYILPGDARITINGANAANGTNYLKNGTYTVEVRRDGFESAKQTITVTDDAETNYIALALNPTSESANKYVKDHAKEYSEFEGFVGTKQSAEGKKFSEQNPLTKSLPYFDPYYTIGYKEPAETGLVITIHTPSPRYRYAALQKIRDLGYDPVNYRFQFIQYTNPLEATR